MIPSPANIEFLHSYLVRSNIKDEDYKPSGAILSLRGAVFNLISKIFERADEECSIDISFKAGEDRSQNNSTRDLLVKVLEASVEEDRSDLTALLADNLLSLTNGRTGAGLLFVIGGKAKGHSRIMLCRFPADDVVIIPFLSGLFPRLHAASFSFMAGVIPPMPMFGRSLLYVHSHCVA